MINEMLISYPVFELMECAFVACGPLFVVFLCVHLEDILPPMFLIMLNISLSQGVFGLLIILLLHCT